MQTPGRRSTTDRIGRGANPPPQFGQTLNSTFSTHSTPCTRKNKFGISRVAAETGMTPAKDIERLRLEAAREQVESGAEPIEAVAACTGFGDPDRMRRAFIRAFGQPPQALRRTAKIGLF